jgi:hypothetical protein
MVFSNGCCLRLLVVILFACASITAQANICISPFHDYHYLTCSDYEYVTGRHKLKIPAYFDTDLASIPRAAWWIMSPAKSEVIEASVVHDWIYRKERGITRKQADIIFYDMLLANHMPKWKAASMYYAVRAFGRSSYHARAKEMVD